MFEVNANAEFFSFKIRKNNCNLSIFFRTKQFKSDSEKRKKQLIDK